MLLSTRFIQALGIFIQTRCAARDSVSWIINCIAFYMNFHWVVRTCDRIKPFLNRDTCVEFWSLLREKFPDTMAAVIMPDHAHWIQKSVIGPDSGPDFTLEPHKSIFARRIKKFERRWGFRFEPIRTPMQIPDRKHLLRQVRYIHLNPCRSRLAQDPLEWEWSTHWDILGLVRNPWINAKDFFDDLGIPNDLMAFHRYVSADPSVNVEGTPFPEKFIKIRDSGLDDLTSAVAAYLRCGTQDFYRARGRRRELIHIATTLGTASRRELSERLRITPQNIGKHLRFPMQADDPPGVQRLLLDLRTLRAIRKIPLGSRNEPLGAGSVRGMKKGFQK
ncbi:MAG: hypothetical protein EBX52_13495 [Proteobacteria bacterium]|nr:hypothetical protein [Pseudomonadota bacterium]